MEPKSSSFIQRTLLPLLKLRVWIADLIKPNETQITLFWAGVIGFLGATASVAFRKLTELLHWVLTGHYGDLVESFQHLSWWQRILLPATGGVLAGLTMLLSGFWGGRKISTDYMEAIVLGDGVVPARLSLIKSASALFTIASGGSIGREGPLVQLSAMLASLVGRVRRTTTPQLRLLVACGAAAGIASAYNAPIGGAMFVSEIILGSIAMESFGPLVFASVVATLTVRQFLGASPLYEIPRIHLNSSWEIFPHLVLGIIAGVCGPLFLRLLHASETAFQKLAIPGFARMAIGGMIVGVLAILNPEVCGNGYSSVNRILHGDWLWQVVLVVLVLKIVATSATLGSGAVGGVFTPTLFAGACLGSLFGSALQPIWPGAPLVVAALTMVGMGAFLAATTHAPIMAITILFELTLDYEIILPLMVACVVAHYTALAFNKKSIYSDSLRRKGAGIFHERLASLCVADLMKKNPACILENARFSEIAESFITHRFNYLYVVNEARQFRGVVSLHDIKGYLNEPELAQLVIARDIMREKFHTIAPYKSLSEALTDFSRHDGERLPVLDDNAGGALVGSISKTDLILALAEQSREDAAA